jgi:maleamate amidohydrolase
MARRKQANASSSIDLTEEKRAFSKFGVGKVGFGSRPVLLVIDMQKEYTDKTNPWYFDMAAPAARNILPLLKAARRKGLPIIYTYNGFRPDLADAGLMAEKSLDIKNKRVCIEGTPGVKIVSSIAPKSRDIVINKKRFSAFFGTDLLVYLKGLKADTIILTGCVTSGCIRMTAYDAYQYDYRVIIPPECVGDQTSGLHEQSLFIMNEVVADVIPVEKVIDEINKLVETKTN